MRVRSTRFHTLRLPLAAALTLGFLLPLPLLADENRPANVLRRTQVVEVVEKNKACTVSIFSERTVSRDNPGKQLELMQLQQRVNGMGTGVIIDPRGYILTNHHVIDDVQVLKVKLHDGSSYTARVIAREPSEDLAIVKIDTGRPLPLPIFGTASDLNVGESVVAIGNAFGYEHTVTVGVVSALKRDVVLNREITYRQLIQTDASINPGNSGGPLFNIHGELVGINVAIRAGAQGIGFTIPVDNALRVSAEMLSVKRRTGMSHGLAIRDMVDANGPQVRRWAAVDRVEAGSPAERAGLKTGDVIDRAGELTVVTALDLERAFIDRSAGDKVALLVRRGTGAKAEGGEELRMELAIRPSEKAPAILPADLVWRKLGVKLAPAPADLVTKANPQLHGGLLIMDVNADSIAGKAGFQRGDILIGLHQWETISVENVTYVLNHPDYGAFSPIRYFRIRAGQLQRGWMGGE